MSHLSLFPTLSLSLFLLFLVSFGATQQTPQTPQIGAYNYSDFMESVRYSMSPFASGHRWPSQANPMVFTKPHDARTEDDVLHIQSLPSFDDQLGQRDSELLMSFLTVPYIRIPLVLNFFATEDRIHTLQNAQLLGLLNAVVFEPGRYIPAGKWSCFFDGRKS